MMTADKTRTVIELMESRYDETPTCANDGCDRAATHVLTHDCDSRGNAGCLPCVRKAKYATALMSAFNGMRCAKCDGPCGIGTLHIQPI